MNPSTPVRRSPARWGAAGLLLVAAGAHMPLVQEHLTEAPYVGWSFLLLSIVSVALAVWVVLTDRTDTWILIGAVCLAALVGHLASRTMGPPEMGDAVGTWTEPMSFPAVTAELFLVVLAGLQLRTGRVAAASSSRRAL